MRLLVPILAMLLAAAPGRAQERTVDLELLLAVDASASVSFEEFALQMQGLSAAFRSESVLEAIRLAAPNGIAVALALWSGDEQQMLAVPWRLVGDAGSAGAFADGIDAAPRSIVAGGTALGDALVFALAQLRANGFAGARRVVDVSGDGRENVGLSLLDARRQASEQGVTVNGLAILNEDPGLDDYFRERLLTGADAFVITAADYADFAEAIRRKLEREIMGAGMVRRAPAGRGTGDLAGRNVSPGIR